MFRVGGKAIFRVFRYQHVSIPNVKLWHWGSKPKPGPNAKSFAPQWNIGLSHLSNDFLAVYGTASWSFKTSFIDCGCNLIDSHQQTIDQSPYKSRRSISFLINNLVDTY